MCMLYAYSSRITATLFAILSFSSVLFSLQLQYVHMKVWDVSIGKCLSTLSGHKDIVHACCSVGASRVVSGCSDGTMKVCSGACGLVPCYAVLWLCFLVFFCGFGLIIAFITCTMRLRTPHTIHMYSSVLTHSLFLHMYLRMQYGRIYPSMTALTAQTWDVEREVCISTCTQHHNSVVSLVKSEKYMFSGSFTEVKV